MLAVRRAGALPPRDPQELLADLRDGIPVKLELEAIVFLQGDDPNRNYTRFTPAALRSMAKTFEGTPFMRDHKQGDLLARGGTVLKSELIDHKGGRALRQTLELVKPWAVEAALDGTLDRFSIGWTSNEPVRCSVCDNPMFSLDCHHFPGDVVELRSGRKVTCELVYTAAVGVETSAVSVPAVEGTGIAEIRAALAAARTVTPKEKRMSFEKLVPILALSADAGDDAVEKAVLALVGNLDRAQALHGAELAAHAATKERLNAAMAQLAALHEADQAKTLTRLLDETRRKIGQKLDERGNVLAGGTPQERVLLSLAKHSIEEAEAFVKELPQVIPIATITEMTAPKVGAPAALSEAEEHTRRQLMISTEDYLKHRPTNGQERT